MKAGQVAEVGRLDEHRRGHIRPTNSRTHTLEPVRVHAECFTLAHTSPQPGARQGGWPRAGRDDDHGARSAHRRTACCSWDLFLPAMEGWLGDSWLPRWRELSRLAESSPSRPGSTPCSSPTTSSSAHSPYWGIPEGESRGTWEAWTLLAALAAETRRAAIGTFVARRRLPQPRPAREDGRDRRRGERGPADPGPGLRLAPARVRRFRLPVRPPGRPVRGGPADPRPPPARGARRLRRALPRSAGVRAPPAGAPARRPADLDRRVPAADDAPGRPLGRRVRHRLASRRREPPRSRSRVSTTPAPRSGGIRRRSAALWA